MKAHYQLPKDILERTELKELEHIHGAIGLGLFLRLFLMCGRAIEYAYILPCNNCLIRDLAVKAKLTKQPYLIKEILHTMSNINILHKKLYNFNLLYMPMVVKIDKHYFSALATDKDFSNELNSNVRYLYNKYVPIYSDTKKKVITYDDFFATIPHIADWE